jgi:hypothetical protein
LTGLIARRLRRVKRACRRRAFYVALAAAGNMPAPAATTGFIPVFVIHAISHIWPSFHDMQNSIIY